MWENTTPVPNWIFDIHLKDLTAGELKVLLIVTRQTLGFVSDKNSSKRKEIDWISGSQLQAKTGCSRKTISCATEVLVKKGLLKITDSKGSLLDTPEKRKGETRLYYQLLTATQIVPVCGKAKYKVLILPKSTVDFTQDLSKKVSALAQKLHITKVIDY